MIELTIAYPQHESASTEAVVFMAAFRGHNPQHTSPTDLTLAEEYIEEAIADLDETISLDVSTEDGSIAIAYDPEISPWRRWYIRVIDALMAYYKENFPEHAFEVVHHIEPLPEHDS